MATIKRVLVAIGVLLGAVAYIWVAAVRAVPKVRQRKAALRARQYGADRGTPPPGSHRPVGSERG